MKILLKLTVVSLASLIFCSAAVAKKEKDIAWPELEQDTQTTARYAGTRMKCFVDTPAFDHFTYNRCFANGNSRTTSAVFKIDGGPSSNFIVYWSDSRCSTTSKTCILPIRWYQSISLSAHVLDLSNNTFSSAAATARYEGFH